MKTRIYLFSILLFIPFVLSTYPALAQKLVHYELYVKDTLVSFAGKEKRAIAVNGQIPMPTLKFKQGDTAEIVVHNLLEESTSLHWHGVFLPNKEDGVPFLTQQPIKPRSTYTYRFPIIQNGTHWYHSHSGLQEQIGMYGNFILEKPLDHADFRKGVDDLPAIPIVLSEWTNLNPDNINRMLHNANDWSAIRKGATQSYFESIHAGMLGIKLANEWKRMNAMDVSDVYYDKILINGREISKLDTINGKPIKVGDQVRLRISNGGASSYFWLRYAGGKIKVVASDGNDVQPVMVDRFLIAVSETYDIILTVPQSGLSYEFSVTTEDRTRSASYFIGGGIKQLISPLPRLKYFQGMKMMNGMTKMNGDLEDNGMKMSLNQMDMNTVMYPEIAGAEIIEPMKPNRVKQGEKVLIQQKETTQSNIVTLNYAMLKSTSKSALPAEAFVKNLKFTLTGNMNRYVWSMDDKTISETDKIRVKKGEVLRITLYNNSMMRHPMHLHGFDFRVINGNGDHSPLKNVLDIMPMETDTIEFLADQRGDWFFHCHILYHMMAGMGRVVSVGDYQNPNLADPVKSYKMMLRETDMPHLMIQNDFATNGNDGGAMLQNSRWSLSSEWRLGYNKMHGYEIETQLGRYIGKMQWFMPFIGFDYRYREMGIDQKEKNLFNQQNRKNTRHSFSVGFNYLLPMLVNFQAQVYPDGIVRLSLIREDIPVSKRFRAGFMLNSDIEYMADLRYIVNRNIAVRTHYDSDMGFGVGVSVGY